MLIDATCVYFDTGSLSIYIYTYIVLCEYVYVYIYIRYKLVYTLFLCSSLLVSLSCRGTQIRDTSAHARTRTHRREENNTFNPACTHFTGSLVPTPQTTREPIHTYYIIYTHTRTRTHTHTHIIKYIHMLYTHTHTTHMSSANFCVDYRYVYTILKISSILCST